MHTIVRGVKRVFGYPDIHWSDRDERALAVADAAHRAFKPDLTVYGGDLLNCGPFARHPKRKLDDDEGYDLVRSELEPVAKHITQAQRRTNGGRVVVLEGNHDEWLERYLCTLPTGGKLRSLLPSQYLMQGRENAVWVPYTRVHGDRRGMFMLHHRLGVVHGWAASKYAADRHLQLAKPYSIIYHHTHRAESRSATMCDGTVVHAMNAGCLCRKIPIYAENGCPSEWSHGFWVAYLGQRSFTMYPVVIERGYSAVMPDGREVKL